jgi:hypothetical protein
MRNPEALTGLLKAREPIGVKTASRLQSSTAANSKSFRAFLNAGRYLRSLCTSAPGRCFS